MLQRPADGHVSDRLMTAGGEAPGADLLSSSVYDELMSDVTEAKHISSALVDGSNANIWPSGELRSTGRSGYRAARTTAIAVLPAGCRYGPYYGGYYYRCGGYYYAKSGNVYVQVIVQ